MIVTSSFRMSPSLVIMADSIKQMDDLVQAALCLQDRP
jgi:hypothetical protein